MFKTATEARAYVEHFLELAPTLPQDVEIVLCPPFTALEAVGEALRQAQGRSIPHDDTVKLGAQNMYWRESGAYTGEVSVPMLLDLGVQYVIIGHSERRQYFGETDEDVRMKTAAALQHGLVPIVAVGETLAIREAGDARAHVCAQVCAALEGLTDDAIARVVIAYEPIWAIGTGRNCDPAQANDIMQAIRACTPALRDVPILYGGSVKPDNIAGYCGQAGIDGALVGGASLDPDSFAALCQRVSL
jgi:triosephosphate isomerase